MRSGSAIIMQAFPQARSLWQVPAYGFRDRGKSQTPDRNFDLEAFSLNGHVIIVQTFTHDHGWTIYAEPTKEGRIDATLDAIAAHCGVPAPAHREEYES